MTLKRLAFMFCILAVATSACAQGNQDPQAVAILQASLNAMASTIPSDSTANGSMEIVAGSQTTEGTIQILTKGTAESLVQFTGPSVSTTLIYASGQANEVVNGAVNVLSLERIQTVQAPEFPLPLLLAILSNSDTSLQYIGLETLNGESVNHIRSWNTFASQPGLQSLANFSTRDIWFDATSGLPVRVSFTRCDAQGATAGIAVDVFFSNYQINSGVAYPYSIQESLNGTPWATITIQSVAFNTGLTDASFTIQQEGQ
jgi:outer membrane lipoprotein-sorting protein